MNVASIFRSSALAAHRSGARPGRPLHLVSTWTRWAVRVTLIVVAAGLSFAATAELGEYAEGVAVVRRADRQLVTATLAGTIDTVSASPGARVSAGQVLARFSDQAERREFERLQAEYDERLVEFLRSPGNPTLRQHLGTLEQQREAARDRLQQLAVLAPCDGLIADVRVHSGQQVAPGDALISIEGDDSSVEIVGLFPGYTRPMLAAADSTVILELEGFPDSRQQVRIAGLADEVIGPAEAMRLIGREREGTLNIEGPVVVVSVVLDDDTIVADGQTYRLYDGMLGKLEAKLRSATIIEHLVPALRSAWGRR